jgi:hypothetical protein
MILRFRQHFLRNILSIPQTVWRHILGYRSFNIHRRRAQVTYEATVTYAPQLGLSDSPTCERPQEKDETATHVLCECEALAHLELRHLGQCFMEPSDYFDVRTYKILHFIRSAGLLRG